MGKQFTDKTVGQMPSVACPDFFNMETFGQLTDDGLHQSPAGHQLSDQRFWPRVLHVLAQGGLQINALLCQFLLQARTE